MMTRLLFPADARPPKPDPPDSLTVIKPKKGWQLINFKELKEYRDLFFFLVWRDIKVLYAQTILGFSWAIILPLVEIALFSLIFGKVAKIGTEGIPYVVFSTVAIIPWTYMSQSMTASSHSLVSANNILGKIYFPRLMFPITPVLSKLVDFSISMVIFVAVAVYYKIVPTLNYLFLPVFILLMISLSAGVGFWLSAMAVRFRDVKHGLPFFIRLLMFTAPIVYSASTIQESHRMIYSLNPIVAVIEGFRASLLGTPIPWHLILPGVLTNLLIFFGGAFYFKRMERIFVDVI